MKEGITKIPGDIVLMGDAAWRGLRVIIEDASVNFFLRRMAVWWGSQFNNTLFNTFLRERFVDGKVRVKLYQKAESSQSEIARAELGLHIAAVEVLNGQFKP